MTALALLEMTSMNSAQAAHGIVEETCTTSSEPSSMAAAFAEWMIQTDRNLPRPAIVDIPAEAARERERAAQDWANLCRYRADNRESLLGRRSHPEVIFMGDSITENWALADPAYFSGRYAGRGISGQTTSQILLRFPEDLLPLKPKIVHILAGTNDIAGNGGPSTLEQVENRIAAMAELAHAKRLSVILGSVLPAANFFWSPNVQPSGHIRALNQWIKEYAARRNFIYVDYYSALKEPNSDAFKMEWSNDGVHPNRNGYAAMRVLADQAISQAQKERQAR
jgi:lysophospholipase L1-like esterase